MIVRGWEAVGASIVMAAALCSAGLSALWLVFRYSGPCSRRPCGWCSDHLDELRNLALGCCFLALGVAYFLLRGLRS